MLFTLICTSAITFIIGYLLGMYIESREIEQLAAQTKVLMDELEDEIKNLKLLSLRIGGK